jgi:cell shape-determining protein MreC
MAVSPLLLMRVDTIPSTRTAEHQELKSLALENHQLRTQLDLVYEWISSEKRLREQAELLRTLGKDAAESKEFVLRRSNEMKSLLQKQTMAAFGRIVYRDPGSWSSSCWIDVGEENNLSLGQTIIAKNSPVVSGSSLVGVVEYVGKKQSRVRLITDSGLKTAVRAVRGPILDRQIATMAHSLIDCLKKRPDTKQDLIDAVTYVQEGMPVRWQDNYLAKGEISGSSAPYFRTLKSTLKGVGFSCDFKDEEGPARDLRSGILREGDLLVTSGLDGVFPPGLKVAIVTKVNTLRPGAFAYELEAAPNAGELSDLSSVYVLPPVD